MFFLLLLFFMSIVFGTAFLITYESVSKKGFIAFKEKIVLGNFSKKLAIALTILLVAEAVMSVILGNSVEYDVELSTLLISYLFNNGVQMYQDTNGPQMYSLLYGPLMALPAAFVFKLGGWITEARLIGVAGGLIYIAAAWHLVKSNKLRFEFMLWVNVAIYCSLYYTFSTRTDSWLFALPMLGAIGASRKKLWVVAITAALAVGIKVTAIFYFIPLAIWVWTEEGFKVKCFLISTFIFIAGVAAPFMIPGVSFEGYLFWIKAANLHKKLFYTSILNIVFLAIIMMPAISLLINQRKNIEKYKRQYVLLATTFFSGLILSYLASKEGSSYYHLSPMIAPVMLLLQSRDDWDGTFDFKFTHISYALLMPMVFIFHTQYLSIAYSETLGRPRSKTGAPVIEEMTSYIREKGDPSLFSMGTGYPKHRQVNASIQLLQIGGTYVLNDMAMADRHASGIKIPQSTLDLIRDCKVPYWLIPAGDEPFHTFIIYRNTEYMAEPIREIFADKYYKEKTGKYFDLWSCKSIQKQ
jgi:hypothetical protein